MKINTVLFDLDGVLVDTARYHFEAWSVLAKQLAIPFTAKENEQLKGVSRAESLERLLALDQQRKVFSEQEKQGLAEQKNTLYLQAIQAMDESAVLPGAKEVLEYLKNSEIKIGLGSASKNARLILEKTKLTPYFDVIVDGTQVSKAKPDPEVFLKGAQQLMSAPASCLIVEDSEAGCLAALTGKMHVLGIGQQENLPSATYVIPNLVTFKEVFQQMLATESVYNS
ncbi:beta-phosphoglucomutase [Enterococcus villorum]|uniref:Beta-phosphoglucomutase n=1 Tax=Enterococcus villorum TaxID=112904 RepID=A0A1V8YAV6_9ENTE|nr:beta-phosphoglucomutase [Enterococcus villorum]OQO69757.1 beta-phosphoglucomutase [Enterococcus villorum]OQO74920.1 beta-phosphoglucomutase [Enterococcus villorum]